jgi:adenylate kinase family enzyme
MIEFKQRVRVIGPPGSYVVVLAKALAEQSNLTYLNLADLEKKPNPYSALQKSLSREKWIVAGSFAQDWAASTVDDATMILYIDTARIVCFFRLLGRYLAHLFSPRKKQHLRDLRVLFHFRKAFAAWKKNHRAAQTRMKTFATVDEAYEFYVRETAPDLFL